jgi:hypothetical protein
MKQAQFDPQAGPTPSLDLAIKDANDARHTRSGCYRLVSAAFLRKNIFKKEF